MHKLISISISILFSFLLSSALLSQEPKKADKVLVNGKQIYYEVYGEGSPLIFLHGYSLSSQSWKLYVNDFKDEYAVYLIDLTGHGKSDPFKEKLSINGVAKDLDALLKHLNLNHIKAVGFSFGGDVLYQLALLNPDLIEAMITIGAVGTWTVDDFPEYHDIFSFENRADFPWLKSSHNSDDQVRGIMDQFKNYKVRLSDEELQTISLEVMVMIGDNDEGMNFDEVARVRKYLPNSDIWILPDVAHGAHEGETKEEFIRKSKSFFSKKR